jgi:two-component system nitrogen regulation response regulator GlnG
MPPVWRRLAPTRCRRRSRCVSTWLGDLEREARRRLEGGEPEVWDALTRQFEGQLIHTALEITRGRRIEAAQRLGIGRNTITRKIQELGLDD